MKATCFMVQLQGLLLARYVSKQLYLNQSMFVGFKFFISKTVYPVFSMYAGCVGCSMGKV